MSYIKQIEPEESSGDLARIYTEISGKRGRVANIYKLHSLDADLMQIQRDAYFHTMFKAGGA